MSYWYMGERCQCNAEVELGHTWFFLLHWCFLPSRNGVWPWRTPTGWTWWPWRDALRLWAPSSPTSALPLARFGRVLLLKNVYCTVFSIFVCSVPDSITQKLQFFLLTSLIKPLPPFIRTFYLLGILHVFFLNYGNLNIRVSVDFCSTLVIKLQFWIVCSNLIFFHKPRYF